MYWCAWASGGRGSKPIGACALKQTIALGLLACLSLCSTAIAEPEVLKQRRGTTNIELLADRVRYTADAKRAILSGNVRVTVSETQTGRRQVIFLSDGVTADLETGQVWAEQGGQIASGPAFVKGQRAWLDAGRDEFGAESVQALMAMTPGLTVQGDGSPLLFMRGAAMEKRGAEVTLQDARVTTCDRENPHFYVGAKRIVYDVDRMVGTFVRPEVGIYGLRIPLFLTLRQQFGPDRRDRGVSMKFPGYSSRDGFFLPANVALTAWDEPWDIAAELRATTKRSITGTAWAKTSWDDWDFRLRGSRQERVLSRTVDNIILSQVPELTLTRHLTPRGGRQQLMAELCLGNYYEAVEGNPGRGQIKERRALAGLRYVANPTAELREDGLWYGAEAGYATYSTDETYRKVEVYAGAGHRFSDRFSGSLTLRQGLDGGTTPFAFDALEIETELVGRASWYFTERLGLLGWGRYDAQDGLFRDYEVALGVKDHCLTWQLYYRDVSESFGIRVDLNGLSGRTSAYETHSQLEQEIEGSGLQMAPRGEGDMELRLRDEAPAAAETETEEQPPAGEP